MLAVFVFFAFSPVLDNDFVNWDDNAYVTENPRIKNLSFEAVSQIFTSFERIQFKPLSFLLFAVENRFFRQDPRGYHAVSIFLHAVNTLLVFGLFFLLRRDLFIAWSVAILFGIHPLRVESVAWVSEQKDLLYGFFFLGAAIAYLFYRGRGRRLWYYLSLVLFCCSLLSKAMVLAFPLLLFAFDMFFPPVNLRQRVFEKAPFFLVSLIAFVLNYVPLQWGHLESQLYFSWTDLGFRFFFYVNKLLFPVRLSAFYPYTPTGVFASWTRIVAFLFLSGCLALGWAFRKNRHFLLGASLFVLLLAPALAVRSSFTVADRYVYVAALGLFYIFAHALKSLYDRRLSKSVLGKGLFCSFGWALVFGLSFLTFQRSAVWHDSVTLWKDVLKKYPDVASGHINIAIAYKQKGDSASAFRHARQAMLLAPAEWGAAFLMGNLYLEQQEFDEAEEFYRRALRLNPGAYDVYNNMGLLCAARGREGLDEAVNWYLKGIQLNPYAYRPYVNLGRAYFLLGQTEEAVRSYRKAVALEPDSPDVLRNLLDVLMSQRRYYKDALSVLERLLVLEPEDASTLLVACGVLSEMDDSDSTRALCAKVLEKEYSSFEDLVNLGALYGNRGDFSRAQDYFRKALALRPQDEQVKSQLQKAQELSKRP